MTAGEASSEAAAKTREAGASAEHGARRAAENPALELAGRAGWVVKALLYGVMGILALGLALGRSGATDQRGSLELLTRLGGTFWGGVLLAAIGLGLAGYALWNFLNAAFDPLGHDDEAKSLGRRLAFAGRGAAYTALLLFAVQLMFGRDSGSSDSTLPGVVAGLLDTPFGPWLTALAGLVVIGFGVGQGVQAVRSSFQQDLEGEDMSEAERRTAVALGRFGAAARGAVFVLIGWFVFQAAAFRDPHLAKGLGGAFGALAAQPAGRVLLALVALGLLALAAHSLAAARWMRLPSSRGRGQPRGRE